LVGILVLVINPLLIVALTALIGLFYVMIKRNHERKEARSKIPCASCQTPILPSASACLNCKTPVQEPVSVGFFGTPNGKPVLEPASHRLKLIEKKRCPNCATRLTGRTPAHTCEACGYALMATAEERTQYTAKINRRFAPVMLTCGVLSIIPVVGVIPAILLYRFALVAPYRRYLPRGSRLFTKCMIQFASLILLIVQLVPVLGIASLPLMAALNFSFYKRSYKNKLPV
jgi:hypothetical protein